MNEQLMRLGLIVPDSAVGPVIRLAERLGGRIEGLETLQSEASPRPKRSSVTHKGIKLDARGRRMGLGNTILDVVRDKPGITMDEIVFHSALKGVPPVRVKASVYNATMNKLIARRGLQYYITEGNTNGS